MNGGLFITFEGTECSGKSTQIKILSERLVSAGFNVVCVREPGGTPIGEEIRHILKHSINGSEMTPETELLLMNASRAQIVRQVIRPALAAGKIVLSDRFYDSTTAYQGFGRGLNLEDVFRIIDFAVGETKPDLTILLDLPLQESLRRRQQRDIQSHSSALEKCGENQKHTLPDRFEDSDIEFFKRVHEGFKYIARKEPQRVKIVDATREIGIIAEEIWGLVSPFLEKFKGNL